MAAAWSGGVAVLVGSLLRVERGQRPCLRGFYRCNWGAWTGMQEAKGPWDRK